MKKLSIIIGALAMFCVVAVIFAEDQKPATPSRENEIGELRQQIADLKSQIQTLTTRLDKVEHLIQPRLIPLESKPDGSVPQLPELVPLPNVQPQSSTPDSWQKKEFSGATYYAVPLAH
jgi:hypothetical protein